jgi:hypothetical protein
MVEEVGLGTIFTRRKRRAWWHAAGVIALLDIDFGSIQPSSLTLNRVPGVRGKAGQEFANFRVVHRGLDLPLDR